jgi:acetyl-CoA carboxylase biotin carboxyl carrier protein
LDLKELKEILQILADRDIAEFELEEHGIKLRIRKAAKQETPPVAPIVAPILPAGLPGPVGQGLSEPLAIPAPGALAASADEGLHVVKSPIVGTFYRARDPNTPPFVEVGDRVKVGQIVCIIEAMKMMNEIECEVAGEVVRIHRENGQPVQYGEPLFAIRP